MTAPAGDGPAGDADSGKGKPRAAAPAPERLAVVSFTRTNPVTGREHRGVGVVVAVDDAGLDVAPVDHGHRLRLTAAQVTVLTGDDTGKV